MLLESWFGAEALDPAGPESRGEDPNGPLGAAPGADPGSSTQSGPVSSELEIAAGRGDSDDDVHFGVAARALGVSRKTVERMVKRGLLARGPSGAMATVSKRALVKVLEERRRDVSYLTHAAEATPARSGSDSMLDGSSQDAAAELQELLRPVLAPLLREFIAAQTRASVLEGQMEAIRARTAQDRARDELLLLLATGGWRERRQARKATLRHYLLREDPSRPSSKPPPKQLPDSPGC
jgi:hypothetical protein